MRLRTMMSSPWKRETAWQSCAGKMKMKLSGGGHGWMTRKAMFPATCLGCIRGLSLDKEAWHEIVQKPDSWSTNHGWLTMKKFILCWLQYHETYFNDNVIWKLWRMCFENKWRIDILANGWGHSTSWNNAFTGKWNSSAFGLSKPNVQVPTLISSNMAEKNFTFFCIKYKDPFSLLLEGSS